MGIGIIGAMDEEVRLLKQEMTISEEVKVADCEFTLGTLSGKEVVLLKAGIGKVNAAIGTTLLIETFKVAKIINTGSAGGVDQTLTVGDIIIGQSVVHHDVDVTAFNYKYGQVPGLPVYFQADKALVNASVEIIKSLSEVKVKTGLIATGDRFMQSKADVDLVRNHLQDVLAVEMEAAAIAQVCHVFQVPFVIIRSLSDIAGQASNVSFESYLEKAAKHAATFIMTLLLKIED